MDSTGVPNLMFINDNEKHRAINKLDALQNLIYLIKMDASDPHRVIKYADQSDALLSELLTDMLPDGNQSP